jgi:4-hydroxy-tetrahydrodipicolinate synthase
MTAPEPALPLPELNCAVTTALDAAGLVDTPRLAAHVAWLVERGVARVAVFGTTGEGPSFSLAERRATLDALVAAGVEPARIIVNTGCAAAPEAAELAGQAAAHGCSACLVMPPFFFPDPCQGGLLAALALTMERLAGSRTRAILYHIPAMTGVPIGPATVARVDEAFPGTLEGVKDSDGRLDATLALIERFPALRVHVGNEPDLPHALRAGAAGTISGLANCAPRLLGALLAGHEDALDGVRRLQQAVLNRPLVPAIKALVAEVHADDGWRRARAPLVALDAASASALAEEASPWLDPAWSPGA